MKKRAVSALIVFAFIAFVSASVQIQSSQIKTNYIIGDKLSGKIVLNISNESGNSTIKASTGGEIRLIDFLSRGSRMGLDYECNVIDCQKTYSTKEKIVGEKSLSSQLSVGFKISGKEVEIIETNLDLQSDAPDSCTSSIEVYLPGSNESIQSSIYKYEFCNEKRYGCFDLSFSENNLFEIPSSPGMCEKIRLSSAPAFFIGAKVINTSTDVRNLTMEIYDSLLNRYGECNLPPMTSQEEELGCIIENPLKEGDYFVCISAPAGDYKIRAENSGEVCGTAELESNEFSFDYEIFARPLKYGSPYISLKNSTIKQTAEGKEIEDYANEYLVNVYGSDCTETCVIPFLIKNIRQTNHKIIFSNKKLRYSTQNNRGETSDLYVLSEEYPKISASELEIDISNADFRVSRAGSFNLSLSIGDKTISTRINVSSGFSASLYPRFALVGIPTQFSILSLENISSVEWNFGEGNNKFGTRNIIHTYMQEGEYNLSLKITNNRGITIEKNFKIQVGDINESLNIIKNQSDNKIGSIKRFVNSLPLWLKESVSLKLNLTEIEKEYNSLIDTLNNSVNDSVKSQAIAEILALDIPYGIEYANIENFPLAIGFDSMNIDYLIKITGEEIEPERKEELRDNLIYWINKNYQPDVVKKRIILKTESGNEVLGEIYTLAINKKTNYNGATYFIIDYPREQMTFSENYGALALKEEDKSFTYINLSSKQTLEFFLPDENEVETLGMYIGPLIKDIGVYTKKKKDAQEFPTGWLIFWISLLIFVFFAIYLALQEWYKNKYEEYLFKNKDDLYNIMTFISNSRLSGMQDSEIKNNLRKMNWGAEQMSYAFRKLDGKRTGMWEIPIFRFWENKRIKKEIEKRSQSQMNGRFIKRPFM